MRAPAARPGVAMSRLAAAGLISIVVVAACTSTPAATGDATVDPATQGQTCEEAFVAWVDTASRVNQPGANVADLLFSQEVQQRTVFELCTLVEAERYNVDHPVELVGGVTKPMIEPDFRTFAEVECVDESPLLDGTRLCAEVGR